MSDEQKFDPIQFAIGVMKDHEEKLFRLMQTAIQQPINHYTDKEGNLDRTLVSQQIALRSTLVLSLSNQLGRLQMALYSLAAQRVGLDYGELLNEMAATTTEFEHGLDRIHSIATGKLPLSPQDEPSPTPISSELDYEAGPGPDDPGPSGELGPVGSNEH